MEGGRGGKGGRAVSQPRLLGSQPRFSGTPWQSCLALHSWLRDFPPMKSPSCYSLPEPSHSPHFPQLMVPYTWCCGYLCTCLPPPLAWKLPKASDPSLHPLGALNTAPCACSWVPFAFSLASSLVRLSFDQSLFFKGAREGRELISNYGGEAMLTLSSSSNNNNNNYNNFQFSSSH